MASNSLASIAAATAAGWSLERTKLDGTFVTRLKLKFVGQPGNAGGEQSLPGESSVSSAAADTAALAACNYWRINRYGGDSTAANVSTVQDAATSPSTQGIATVHRSLTKDKN